ncbi:hypothetical protein GCM10010096_08450 [Alcaligenes pakistanensis]|uniref:Outer membrane protein assembly factor BamE n=1 Tax=Alcaligenes pakistanensis TaxID=1482717 RepID=A0A8H9IMY9_9BURK|nr:hypothetical protein GCM10010096_08450 [Alcaligenes pakistanensis]
MRFFLNPYMITILFLLGHFVQKKANSFTPVIRAILAATLAAAALSACGSSKWGFPYRADIQQGNWITAEQVARLQAGMTREQVRYLLGSPTLQDIFNADRWDYPYLNQPGYGKSEQRTFTVWFEGDTLVRWEGDEQPDRQPFERSDTGKKQTPPPADADNAAPTPTVTGTQPTL